MTVTIELETDKKVLTHQELIDLICEQYYVYDTFEVK